MYSFIILLIFGIILITFGILNRSLSFAPSNIEDLNNSYGKIFAIKVEIPTSDEDEFYDKIKETTRNATILMILSMIIGSYLILFSMYKLIIKG